MTVSMTKEQVYQAADITRQGYFCAKGRQSCKQDLEDITLQKVLSFKEKQPKIGARVMYYAEDRHHGHQSL